ncbi:MAG: 4Fe-4S binding protein [Bacillota bacterium]|nr:4Fe-4S binding protein [Bacillota bacterium]
MAYTIVETCIGCSACEKVCPTDAIWGRQRELFHIDPELCIDCGACARVCPVQAIHDATGYFPPRIARRADWPKPVVNPDLCSGCTFCVDICPFDCLEIEGGSMFGIARLVRPNACVSCGECEEVCIKGAIVVPGVRRGGQVA